jgi:hypothetical protein
VIYTNIITGITTIIITRYPTVPEIHVIIIRKKTNATPYMQVVNFVMIIHPETAAV